MITPEAWIPVIINSQCSSIIWIERSTKYVLLGIHVYTTFTYIITYLFTNLLGGSGSGQTTLSCKDIYDADKWVKHK